MHWSHVTLGESYLCVTVKEKSWTAVLLQFTLKCSGVLIVIKFVPSYGNVNSPCTQLCWRWSVCESKKFIKWTVGLQVKFTCMYYDLCLGVCHTYGASNKACSVTGCEVNLTFAAGSSQFHNISISLSISSLSLWITKWDDNGRNNYREIEWQMPPTGKLEKQGYATRTVDLTGFVWENDCWHDLAVIPFSHYKLLNPEICHPGLSNPYPGVH